MPSTAARHSSRGSVDELPSGALRVRVYTGKDPVTGRRHTLVEVIPPGPKAARRAEETRTRLLAQVDDRCQSRTSTTVNALIDEHVALSTWECSTRETLVDGPRDPGATGTRYPGSVICSVNTVPRS